MEDEGKQTERRKKEEEEEKIWGENKDGKIWREKRGKTMKNDHF